MKNRPDAADLLAVARETLLKELRPRLDEGDRYTAAMIANAMAIAARELQAGEAEMLAALERLDALYGARPQRARETPAAALDARERELARDIRSGAFDADGERRRAVLEHLRLSVRARLAVSNPRALRN